MTPPVRAAAERARTVEAGAADRLAAGLRSRIEERTATVAVVGLGYVGLPLVVGAAAAGFGVVGFDVDEELERAKGHTRGGIVLGLEDPSSRMSRLGKSELIRGEILSVDELVARVDAVTLEDVNRVSRELLRPEGRVLTVVGPFKLDEFDHWDGA